MDIGMPIKNGHEATVEIFQLQNNLKDLINKEIEEYGQSHNQKKSMIECEIIALTSFTDKEMREKSI